MLDDTFTKGPRGEFRGDFTRDTFDPLRHFSRVLMQQGRVQLDSDWNEQVSIMWYYFRTLVTDIFGPHWTPVYKNALIGTGEEDIYGFEIKHEGGSTFSIGEGHYYVKGVLCENAKKGTLELNTDLSNQLLLVYLDVWERHVSYVEDDYIREKALNGPDTASRAKVVWQVKGKQIELSDKTPDYKDYKEDYLAFLKALGDDYKPGTGKLKARAKRSETTDDPCLISPESHYRGAENQLYRVEIHNSSLENGGPTFKWSRENGSVIFPIRAIQEKEVWLEHLGKDARFSLKANDWVEIVNDDSALKQQPDALLQVKSVDHETMKVTLSDSSVIDDVIEKHPYLRRWDQNGKTVGDNGTITVVENEGNEDSQWLTLENEIKIQFLPQNENEVAHIYQTGDYWLIPARTVTGDVEWPGTPDNPDALRPQGVEHHYAPLALIKLDDNDPTDLRRKFKYNWESNQPE